MCDTPTTSHDVISQPTRRLALHITRSSPNTTNIANMAVSPPSESPRKLLWATVYKQLLRHAAPDSRHNYDFLSFVPSFRGADDAVARATSLPCYKEAKTLLVTSDNSLEGLRHQALKDGKKVLVGTYRLRRGFVLLEPQRIGESRLEVAACLDGMEKPGVGRRLDLAQLRDEGVKIDMCAIGGLVFNEQGVVVWEGSALFEVQWALLQDLKVLGASAPVVALAHDCQVVDEAQYGLDVIKAEGNGEVQCDFVVTPERTLEVEGAVKPKGGVDFSKVDPEALNNIPPLQELKGIRMMEQIMSGSGFGTKEQEKEEPKAPSAEEQMGIDIVERLMRGLKS
jgi:5-formyltetrahydrofolate cyclo-ligase